jgi:predicted AAA+ superfamily ATPase
MALKYFYESAPHLHIIAAGSYLGMSLQKLHNFPVGKVDFLEMYPMNFEEFLLNSGEQMLIGYLKSGNREVVNTFHERLTQLLRVYYYTGGMPEVVLAYFNTKDFAMVRQLQSNILTGYENDFGKYAPANIFTRIRMIWNSIPAQLAKDNRKFMYSMLKKGGRAAEFETALQWLSDAGLVRKALCVTKPSVPLSSYLNTNAFKLFLLDIGLLQAMSAVDHRILLDKNKILTEYKGAMTEQYVAQQLAGQYGLFYWTAPKGTAEIDFLIQHKDSIIPIEVKAEENLKSKSLKVYTDKFSPHTSVRISMSPYREESWLTNIPLYEVPFLSILVDLS